MYGRVLQSGVRDGRLVAEGDLFRLAKKPGWRERWSLRPGPALALVCALLWIVSLAALGDVAQFIYHRF